jgi:hypothetical protein
MRVIQGTDCGQLRKTTGRGKILQPQVFRYLLALGREYTRIRKTAD